MQSTSIAHHYIIHITFLIPPMSRSIHKRPSARSYLPESTAVHQIVYTGINQMQHQLTHSLASTWAPASISTRQADSSPFSAAKWRGVNCNCIGCGAGGVALGKGRGIAGRTDGGGKGGIGNHGLDMIDMRNCHASIPIHTSPKIGSSCVSVVYKLRFLYLSPKSSLVGHP